MKERVYTANDVHIENGVCIIPDGYTSIEMEAFCYHDSLTSVYIPNSVTSIGYGAFDRCRYLTSITYHGTHTVRCIDTECIELRKSRSAKEYTFYRARHFGDMEKCFVAERHGIYARGRTESQAKQDLEFKLCRDVGIELYKDYTLDSSADYLFYSIMTRDYLEHAKASMRLHGISITGKNTVREVIERCKDDPRHWDLIQNLKKLGILE